MGMPAKPILGVIGGSGVYQMAGAKVVKEHELATPFGTPSDAVMELEIDSTQVFFIPRHGRGHRYTPTEVPYQANIMALKMLGVTEVLAVSAVGIMEERIKPGDFVIPDQIYDRTKGVRNSTYFGDGCVGHVAFADPFCGRFSQQVENAARSSGATVHKGGTYLCMEGPQFSTRAESRAYRALLKPAVIGMTAVPEAKLAREAEMCYGLMAMATDYDCWHETEEDVSVEAVLAVLRANSERANAVIRATARGPRGTATCKCHESGKFAIISDQTRIPAKTKERLSLLYGKYWH